MSTSSIKDVSFDDAVTSAMGEAFDKACKFFQNFGPASKVHEIIAKRIVDAAKNGERDPIRLHEKALVPFGIADRSMLVVVGVGFDPQVSSYASVTHAA